jgi:hypothetical protein
MVAAARPQGRQVLSVAVTVDADGAGKLLTTDGPGVCSAGEAQEASKTAQASSAKKKLLKS